MYILSFRAMILERKLILQEGYLKQQMHTPTRMRMKTTEKK
jgi:hypothetical protein